MESSNKLLGTKSKILGLEEYMVMSGSENLFSFLVYHTDFLETISTILSLREDMVAIRARSLKRERTHPVHFLMFRRHFKEMRCKVFPELEVGNLIYCHSV